MARILLAWELGGGWGHALPLRWLADALHARGHRVQVAARDALRTARIFTGTPHPVLQAPAFAEMRIAPQQMSSLADVLWYDAGGHDAATCALTFQLWRNLLSELRIDLLIADAAPMAVAAAQGLCPVLEWEVGFHTTDQASWNIFRDWEKVDAARIHERARRLLDHINQARAGSGLAAAPHLAGAFQADAILIHQLPELDARGARPGVLHVPLFHGSGVPPAWPSGTDSSTDTRRVLVYVKANYIHLDRLLGALLRVPNCEVLLVHDGIPAARIPRLPHLTASDRPIDLGLALPTCALVVCHGGSLQSQALAAGVPTLGLPMHTEQFLQCRAAVATGSSLMLGPGEHPDFLSPLRQLLDTPGCRAAAIMLAERAKTLGSDPAQPVLAAVDRLLDLSVPHRQS